MPENLQRFTLPTGSHHRRPDKVAKKYYLSPDVVALIEAEAQRTSYPRNIIIEMLVRDTLGKPAVEEAVAFNALKPKPRVNKLKEKPIDIFSN